MKVDVRDMPGVHRLTAPTHADERGHFVKIGEGDALPTNGDQQLCSSFNQRAGTVRGLHYQVTPYDETKLVWCLRGAVLDVVVDLRQGEPTYGDWAAAELSDPGTALLVPPGVAHGYQTLADATTLVYLISGVHSPAHARTLRWDDPTVGVDWPSAVTVISEPDRTAASWPPGS